MVSACQLAGKNGALEVAIELMPLEMVADTSWLSLS